MADNVLTRKIGPLPTWGWVAIVGGGIAAWAVLGRRKGGAGSTPGNSFLTPPEIIQVNPPEQDHDTDDDDDPHKRHKRHQHRKHGFTHVPNVIGEEYGQAADKIDDAGLKARRTGPAIGRITRESPHPGARVRRGTTVTLGSSWRPSVDSRAPGPNAHPVR